MAEGEPSDRSLMSRIRGGSQGAAGELHRRYAERLLAFARTRIGTDWQVREDAEDVVQSVFGSFFRGANRGLYQAPEGEELWGLFLVIALNKIRAKAIHHRAAKRDVRRTQIGSEASEGSFEAIDDDAAAGLFLKLVVDEIIGQLPDSHRETVRLRVEGFEVAEIAAATGRSKRSTERILQEFRGRMLVAGGVTHEHSDGSASRG